MSKKQLNVQAITNELEGSSLFFQRPAAITASSQPETVQSNPGSNPQPIEAKSERTNVGTNERWTVGTIQRTPDRLKVRHTFDIYVDQLHALQAFQLRAVQRGKRKPTLGKMVQQAIDLYLKRQAKRSNTEPKNERSDVRTDDGTFG